MAILLSDDELEALQGLPMLAFRVYVAAIRPRMDIRSGMVGTLARISYQALIEWAYVEPVPGVRHEAISQDQMFRAVRALERAGLLSICSDRARRRLLFKCLLAETLSHGQKQAATKPRQQAATAEASDYAAYSDMAATPESTQAAKHQSKENNLSTSSSSSGRLTAVGTTGPRERGRVETPERIAPQRGAEGPHEATEPPEAPRPAFELTSPEKRSPEKELIFPLALEIHQRRAIGTKLKDHHQAQRIVDELAGHMRRKQILNPVRYIDFIVCNFDRPEWVPEFADGIEGERKKESEYAAMAAAARAAPAPADERGTPPPAKVREEINRLLRKAN